jgi:hypothetical protein
MKTIKTVIIFFFVVSLLTNCSKNKDSVELSYKLESADNLDQNEYQIYSLILNKMFPTSNVLVVEQKTSMNKSYSYGETYYASLKAENKSIDPAIFTDFVNRNDTVYNLESKFMGLTKSVILISSEEIRTIFDSQDINNNWNQFYKKYPKANGTIKFTRVGFNSNKSQGIVELGHYYASLGADGYLVYLVKEKDTWKIVKIIITWVS